MQPAVVTGTSLCNGSMGNWSKCSLKNADAVAPSSN